MMTEQSSKRNQILLLVAVCIGFVWVGYLANINIKTDFWSLTNYLAISDYALLSLGHALNIEYWLSTGGDRIVDYFQLFHPGVPLQIGSWLSYRAMAFWDWNRTENLLANTLIYPESFWTATRLFAASLTLISLFYLWNTSRKFGIGLCAAVLLALFCYSHSWVFSLSVLGNESFALPIALLFFGAAHKAFFSKQHQWIFWVVCGCFGGIAYLNKLNYITWSFAAIAALFVAWIVRASTLRTVIGYLASFLVGFVSSVLLIGVTFLSWAGFKRTLIGHTSVFTGSEYFGTGEPTFVSGRVVLYGIQLLFKEPGFFAVMLIAWLLVAYAIASNRAKPEWLKTHLPYVSLLLFSILLGLLAAIKHPSGHYLIVPLVIIPILLIWVANQIPLNYRKGVGIFLSICFLALTINAVSIYLSSLKMVSQEQASYQQDVETVRQKELEDGKIRIWTYGVRSPEYRVAFAVSCTAWIDEYNDIYITQFPHDRILNSPTTSIEKDPWQYMVFDRAHYPTLDSIPANIRAIDHTFIELKHLYLLERTDTDSL